MYFFLDQVQAAIRSSAGSKASLSEAVEASVIYVRFKAAASEVKFSNFFFFGGWVGVGEEEKKKTLKR